MADEAPPKSGSIPGPVPEVRDEGPGGSDLSFSETPAAGGNDASDDDAPGHVPHPVPQGSTEDPSSTD